MKKDRHNIFKRTHKGLRSMLFEAGSKIQQTDFSKPREAKATMGVIKQATNALIHHINKEDGKIYHAVVTAAPYIIAMIEKSNARDIQLATAIEAKLEEYTSLINKQDQAKFGFDLQASFFEFTAAVLQHMNKEESVVNDLLWTNYTDSQIVEMESEIMTQMFANGCTWFTERIMTSLTNQEIVEWVNIMAENADPIVSDNLVKSARTALSIERWQMIRGKFLMRKPQLAAA